MLKNSKIVIFSLFILVTQSNGVGCNHHCPECKFIMPIIKAKATELKEYYLKLERETTQYYSSLDIPKKLKVKKKLLTEIEKLQTEIKMLKYKNSVTLKEINKNLKSKINQKDISND